MAGDEVTINPATAAKGICVLVERGILKKMRGQAITISENAAAMIKERKLDQMLCIVIQGFTLPLKNIEEGLFMIRSNFILCFFGFIIINLCACILVNFEFKNKKVIAFLGYIISLMIIISLCFFPFPFQDSLLEDMIQHNEGLANNFVPFKSIFSIIKEAVENKIYIIIVYQIIGNIILFMPAGFSLYFFVDKKRRMLRGLICIIFTSLSVEALQGVYGIMLSINYRSVDIDDLILNVIGGVLGFIVASFVYDCKNTLFARILRNGAE